MPRHSPLALSTIAWEEQHVSNKRLRFHGGLCVTGKRGLDIPKTWWLPSAGTPSRLDRVRICARSSKSASEPTSRAVVNPEMLLFYANRYKL